MEMEDIQIHVEGELHKKKKKSVKFVCCVCQKRKNDNLKG